MYTVNFSLINEKYQAKYNSQGDFAEAIGISQSKVSRFLTAKSKNVDLELLSRISKILKLELHELIIDDEDDVKIQSETNIINDMEIQIEKLYKTIKTLKESHDNNFEIVKDRNADIMMVDRNSNNVYHFDIKASKNPRKNLSKKLYDYLFNYYIDNLTNNESKYKNEYILYANYKNFIETDQKLRTIKSIINAYNPEDNIDIEKTTSYLLKYFRDLISTYNKNLDNELKEEILILLKLCEEKECLTEGVAAILSNMIKDDQLQSG